MLGRGMIAVFQPCVSLGPSTELDYCSSVGEELQLNSSAAKARS